MIIIIIIIIIIKIMIIIIMIIIIIMPVIYKGFTSILATKIRDHLISNELIPSEQKGNSINSKGCIDQLLIDIVILSDAK